VQYVHYLNKSIALPAGALDRVLSSSQGGHTNCTQGSSIVSHISNCIHTR